MARSSGGHAASGNFRLIPAVTVSTLPAEGSATQNVKSRESDVEFGASFA